MSGSMAEQERVLGRALRKLQHRELSMAFNKWMETSKLLRLFRGLKDKPLLDRARALMREGSLHCEEVIAGSLGPRYLLHKAHSGRFSAILDAYSRRMGELEWYKLLQTFVKRPIHQALAVRDQMQLRLAIMSSEIEAMSTGQEPECWVPHNEPVVPLSSTDSLNLK